ncbi:hypothetical protein ACTVZO_41380 [Streptomyces sp. IBSNAI002]|uniref:hypothetical protein n=1 Tax=Streptomyces sp. IBSNAI002 TaxID=3457500 RepID=UPI003FD05955
MSDLTDVWQAHRAAETLSSTLASFYEEGSPAGQRELTDAQKNSITEQFDKVRRLLDSAGVSLS